MRKVALTLLSISAAGMMAAPVWAATSWRDSFSQGQTSLGLQELPQAEAHFRAALKQVESQSKDASDIASCINKLADTLALRQKTAEARTLYARALALLEGSYGKNSPKVAPALISLGSIQESEGDSQAAMTYYQRAFKINEKNYGPYSPQIVTPLHRLGRAAARSGKRDVARGHYKQALQALLEQPGLAQSREMQSMLGEYRDLSDATDTSSKDLLADFKADMQLVPQSRPESEPQPQPQSQSQPLPLRGLQSEDQSASSFQQQSTVKRQDFDKLETEMAPSVVSRQLASVSVGSVLDPAYQTMAGVIFDQGHYDQGTDFYQRKVAVDIKSLGDSHPSVANDLNALAMSYIAAKRYSEADVFLTRALTIYQKSYGQDNALTIRTAATLAQVKFKLRQFDKAAALYKLTLNYGLSVLGPNNIECARVLNDLAYLYYNQDKLQDALTYYQWALASTRAAVGDKDPLYAACLKDYARVLRSMGRQSEALAAESRADAATPPLN